MSILTNGVMTDGEGHILELALDCGIRYTDDDCEFMRGSIKSVVLFARAFGGSNFSDTVAKLIEQERIEWRAAYDALPPNKPPFGGRNRGTGPDHVIQHVLTIAHEQGDAAAVQALALYCADLDKG